MKRWKPYGALLALALFALPVGAANEASHTFVLYDGSTFDDTLSKSSRWINIRGANRIIIRMLSAGTGAHTGADSQYTDSLSVVSYLFSDSVSFIGRDSAGVLVTANSNIPFSNSHGPTYPICADSIMVTAVATNASVGDSARKMVTIGFPPVLKALRPAVTGSGTYTLVACQLPPGSTTTPVIYGDGTLMAQYFKMRVTPAVRSTTAGFSSTQGIRTKGVRGLRAWATVYYRDR